MNTPHETEFKTTKEVIDDHRDPITGSPHSHPTATGIGAATAGAFATVAGAIVAGPLGAVAGAIVGSSAGGLAGHSIGESNEKEELREAIDAGIVEPETFEHTPNKKDFNSV